MSVDYSAKCVYGYKVDRADIPDYQERVYNEFGDLADKEGGWTVTIFDHEYDCYELAKEESDYYDGPVYIGPEVSDGLTFDGLNRELIELTPVATRMYELVMRKQPEEKPRMHYYCHAW